MICPTDKILRICESHKVPLTIMFEVNEYEKFLTYEKELIKDLGYSPARMIRDQIIGAYRKGHDIQPHLHPQWIKAKYSNKKWEMENPEISITEFSQPEIDSAVRQAVILIKKMLCPYDPNYRPSLVRLSNLPWIEAPADFLNAMANNNIHFHSLATADSPQNTECGFWPLDSELNLFEIPIHSKPLPGYRQLTWLRVKTAFYRAFFTNDKIQSQGTDEKKTRLEKIKKLLFGIRASKWDFCKQSSVEMLDWLKAGMERYAYTDYCVPLIMIGHSKDFFNEVNFNRFILTVLEMAGKNDQLCFSSLSQIYPSLINSRISSQRARHEMGKR